MLLSEQLRDELAYTRETVIKHEEVHLAQMLRYGTLKYYLRYIFSRTWRYKLEAEAYAVQVIRHFGNKNAYSRDLAKVIKDNYRLFRTDRGPSVKDIHSWIVSYVNYYYTSGTRP